MLHWESHGTGEPVLMIMGLGGSSAAWARLLPYVSDRHRAIVFDHRGTGQSAAVRGPSTMTGMVADALGVLDAAGERSAHVMGVSMGGMIAQHLALNQRQRVRSLILACTTPSGLGGQPPLRLLAASALRPLVGAERSWQLVTPTLYSRATRHDRPERIREDLAVRGARPTPSLTFLAQLAAIPFHDTRGRLSELDGLGVTIIHGDEDAVVPARRAAALASAIPGAQLVMIPACGHMLTTDAEQESAAAVLAHLARHASPPSSLAA